MPRRMPLLLLLAAQALFAQTAQLTDLRSGLADVGGGWAEEKGDNLAWAQPGFDASAWRPADLDNLGPAEPGWHWFRKQLDLGPEGGDVWLLLEGGEGTYEVYVNGARVAGASLHSAFNVYRPTEQVFELEDSRGDYTIALRTRAPANYREYELPLFLSASMGSQAPTEYERAALRAGRLYGVWPSLAINLLLCAAGIGAFFLFLGQRGRREYLWLSLYLFVLGLANGLWNLQQSGAAPTWCNVLVSDPLIYVYTILQIEFTFSFVGKRTSRALRAYQAVLLLPWICAGLCWNNLLPLNTYALLEAGITIPAAVTLTALLLVWYRRGNREAGWLILPSLLPLAMGGLYDLGTASIVLGWQRFDFLDSSIAAGVLELQPTDLANLLFLVAIAVVMFFRFARVSREQAHAEAELEAAREVQRRLVPPAADTPGFRIESAYRPAAQVGGDFYHVRALKDRSLLVVLGDASGKGLPAALGVSAIIGALRAMPDLAPGLLLAALNRGLSGHAQSGFVTCCALRVAEDGRAALANAGHLPPYCNGRELESRPGFPLGIVADAEYEEVMLRLQPGDTLTLLSDGVVEARDKAGELFGFERTQVMSGRTAEEIAEAAQAFGQEDDITVLTLRREATDS